MEGRLISVYFSRFEEWLILFDWLAFEEIKTIAVQQCLPRMG
jgi:hypothetical protein